MGSTLLLLLLPLLASRYRIKEEEEEKMKKSGRFAGAAAVCQFAATGARLIPGVLVCDID